MSDDGMADDGASPVLCVRCVRVPRDPDDWTTWFIFDDEQVCPGCVTQSDRERLRMDEQS